MMTRCLQNSQQLPASSPTAWKGSETAYEWNMIFFWKDGFFWTSSWGTFFGPEIKGSIQCIHLSCILCDLWKTYLGSIVVIMSCDIVLLICRSFMHFLTGVCAIIGGIFTGKFILSCMLNNNVILWSKNWFLLNLYHFCLLLYFIIDWKILLHWL